MTVLEFIFIFVYKELTYATAYVSMPRFLIIMFLDLAKQLPL